MGSWKEPHRYTHPLHPWDRGELLYKSYDCGASCHEFEASCLEASCLKASLMWGELFWGELSLGRDVRKSPRHGLYVNSLLGLSVKPKGEIESRSTMEKKKSFEYIRLLR